MKGLKSVMWVGFIAVVGLVAAPAMADTVDVTNNNDGGTGSFRAAVQQANGDPSITGILFQPGLDPISIGSTIEYTGGQALSIDGEGAVIEPSGSTPFDLFVSSGDADLTLAQLTFQKGLNGVVVEVSTGALGEVSVSLFDVTVQDNAEFGLWIDDGTSASDASIGLDVASSVFAGNGTGAAADCNPDPASIDCDGIRVDERGNGNITANVTGSVFVGNGADGLELDEGGRGDVTATLRLSTFEENGVVELEGDDGLDIDEADRGNIWLQVAESTFNGHTDDGIGMDESGAGDLRMSLVQVEASGNEDKGLSIDESDEGDLEADLNLVTTNDNDDNGVSLEEAGVGDFIGLIVMSTAVGNGDDDIDAAQETPGSGSLCLDDVTHGGLSLDGVVEGGCSP